MNRDRDSSVANAARTKIDRGGPDRLWTYSDFGSADRAALAAALSRLVRTGQLIRVRRGVYYRAKPTMFGLSSPDPRALADAVSRARGERPVPSGVGEYSRLGLTTQASGTLTRATQRRGTREMLGGVRVESRVRPLNAQKGIVPAERTALDALRDITRIPDARPTDVLRRLGLLIRSGELDFVRLARYARAEPPRVRALLGALGDELRHEGARRQIPIDVLAGLRESLNRLTSFAVPGARHALPHSASSWRIK
jgi:hypothetical protein